VATVAGMATDASATVIAGTNATTAGDLDTEGAGAGLIFVTRLHCSSRRIALFAVT
jgi:hypothetical protein